MDTPDRKPPSAPAPPAAGARGRREPSRRAPFGGGVPAVAALLLLAGCAVGPNYERPPALGTNAMPGSFDGAVVTNVGAWKPAEPSAHLARGAWWEMFGDPEL